MIFVYYVDFDYLWYDYCWFVVLFIFYDMYIYLDNKFIYWLNFLKFVFFCINIYFRGGFSNLEKGGVLFDKN